MNFTDPLHDPHPRTNWQILGELKLRADSNTNGTVKAWLNHLLSGFSLPDDLVSRLLKSMEDAAVRVLIPDGAEAQLEQLEIVVLVPAVLVSEGQTWGFFRVERTSTVSNVRNSQGHCIDYYLYLDRKPGEHKPTP